MIHRVHKWLGVTAGIFLLVWLISGIVMVLPDLIPSSSRQPAPRLLNVEAIEMPPAEAIAAAAESLRKSLNVISMALLTIRNVVVYQITMRDGGSLLIDPRTRRVFEITPELAELIVRDNFPTQASIHRIERVEHHDLSYPWGALPAYRVVFGDKPDIVYHVSTRDGAVQLSDPWSRVQAAIGSLHTFEPLKYIVQKDEVRNGLLILLSVVGVGTAATGYYLALSR
jgi:hypothetical protein